MNAIHRVTGIVIALILMAHSPCSIAQQQEGAATGANAVQDAEPAKQKTEKPQTYDETADAAKDIENALAKARKENRRVLIQWGANWCGWCHLLHDTFKKNPQVRRKLQYEYDVVLVDIGRGDKHKDLAAKYGADLQSNGVPFLTVLDAEGNVITNQETGALEAKIDGKNGHDPEKVVAFLTEHQAPYRQAEEILDDGLKMARKENKRVFVHFGAPWCGWCHRLEDWMATKEVHKLLSKDFVDVKIDIDRTIGGKEMLAHYRKGASGGIPWFVFLDADGEALVTSDDPGQNVGCPYTDEEIDQFGAILEKAVVRLANKDIDELKTRLRQARDNKK